MEKATVEIPVSPVSYRKLIEYALAERRKNFMRHYGMTLKHISKNRVHDLRISIRRLATVLKLLDNLKRSWKLHVSMSDLSQLMKKLGALRDQHVFLKWLDYFSSDSENEYQMIRDLWLKEEKRLVREVVSGLNVIRVKRIGDFTINKHMDAVEQRLGRTGTSLKEACRNKISGHFRQFLRLAEKFKRTGKSIDLHFVRISFKKFRYSVEIFPSFYQGIDPEEFHDFQTDLGMLNDLDLLLQKLTWDTTGMGEALPNLQPLLDKIRIYHKELFQKVEQIFKGDIVLIAKWKERMKENIKKEAEGKKADIYTIKPEVIAMCERFDPDPPHSLHVTALALKLFDELKKIGLHKLDDHHRKLLEYSCILHDIGWVKGQKKHHKLSYLMILESELTLNRKDKLETALIARFHRKAEPDKQKDFLELTPTDRRVVAKLAAIIRIADLLDRVHNQKSMIENVALGEDAIVLSISPGTLKDLAGTKITAKSSYFSRVFHIPVRIIETKTR